MKSIAEFFDNARKYRAGGRGTRHGHGDPRHLQRNRENAEWWYSPPARWFHAPRNMAALEGRFAPSEGGLIQTA